MRKHKKFEDEGYVEDLIKRAKHPFFENLPYHIQYCLCHIRALFIMCVDALEYYRKKDEMEYRRESINYE